MAKKKEVKAAPIRGQIRQGDVLVDVEIQPTVATERVQTERVILAYGEQTGHMHEVVAPDMAAVSLMTDPISGAMFLKVDGEGASLTHQEHSHITVAPGLRPVIGQEEWTDAEEPIRVAD